VDIFNYRPMLEGFRYVRADSRRTVTLFVKTGLSLIGANWVILPVMGEKLFPVHMPGIAAAEAGTLGMSLLLGSRGIGAMVGSFGGSWFSGTSQTRLRYLVMAGFVLASAGYIALSAAPNVGVAVLSLIVAHAGGSATWVGSTSMLQHLTEDKFRGRVFSAEFAFSMLVLGVVSFGAGVLNDAGMSIRTIAFLTGVIMLAPFLLWVAAQRLWKDAT
jgi:hypothetical protein